MNSYSPWLGYLRGQARKRMNSYSPWHGYLRGQSPLPLEFQSVFESLAAASPRISHPLSGGNESAIRAAECPEDCGAVLNNQ